MRPQTRWGKLADALATRGDLVKVYQTAYALFTPQFLKDLSPAVADDASYGLGPAGAAALRDPLANADGRTGIRH